MARDLKNGKQARERIDRQNRDNKKKNDKLAKRLDELGIRVTHESLLKLKLYEELKGHKCPYTGQQIALSPTSANELALFSDKVQIEHIVPWSRSLNDSYTNKTLCAKEENIAKGDKTPFEFYSSISSDKWDTVRNQALNILPKEKFHLFIRKEIPADFVNRQLNDTRYISRQALAYLKTICKSVNVCTGQHTARLRHMWGLNSILNPAEDSKTRDDHRHHALDAITIAFTRQETLTELTKWNKYQRSYDLKNFDPPYTHFRADVENSIESILVSHKKVDRVITTRHIKQKVKHKTAKGFETIEVVNKVDAVRGQLHNLYYYGKIFDNIENEHVLTRRVNVNSLKKMEDVFKIIDSTVRSVIINFLKQNGVNIQNKKSDISKISFFKYDEYTKKSIPLLYMPVKNTNGIGNPIKKVRIKYSESGLKLYDNINKYVFTQNNYGLYIFKDNSKYKWKIVSFYEKVSRVKNKTKIDDYLLSIKKGDLFVFESITPLSSNNVEVYIVKSISDDGVVFWKHTEAKGRSKKYPFNIRLRSAKSIMERKPIKVFVNPIGQISTENDI